MELRKLQQSNESLAQENTSQVQPGTSLMRTSVNDFKISIKSDVKWAEKQLKKGNVVTSLVDSSNQDVRLCVGFFNN